MQSSRRRFTAEQKAAILRRHFIYKVSICDLCDEHKIQPGLFYLWQRQALDNLPRALEAPDDGAAQRRQLERQRRIEALEDKLAGRDAQIWQTREASSRPRLHAHVSTWAASAELAPTYPF